MLTATEARNASVQGTFRNPSTKRSDVVKPTSNNPPTISHSQGIGILHLSLDEHWRVVTLSLHDEAADHRQQDRAAALPRVHGAADCRRAAGDNAAGQLGAR